MFFLKPLTEKWQHGGKKKELNIWKQGTEGKHDKTMPGILAFFILIPIKNTIFR